MHTLSFHVGHVCAVLCVMGGASYKPQDMHGEAALLLDTLDLVLHSAAVASASVATTVQPDQLLQDDLSSIIPDLDDPSLTMSGLNNASSTVPDQQQQQQHACGGDSSRKPRETRQTAAQTDQHAASLLWGLRAVAAMAKQGALTQPCAHMLSDYLLERVVSLTLDWPVEVGQAAVEVSMNRLHCRCCAVCVELSMSPLHCSCCAILWGDLRCRLHPLMLQGMIQTYRTPPLPLPQAPEHPLCALPF